MNKTDFQTPEWICKYMVSLLPVRVNTVLEPTPGIGNIVKELKENWYEVTAPDDFYNVTGRFDAIVMNPPFTPMKTGYDFLYKCMDMSNNIIALMPWLTLINSQKRTADLKRFGLKTVTHLPRSVFPGSRVQCCILELNAGYKGNIEFKILVNVNGHGVIYV